jgi:hypothetical protein
MLLPLSSVTVRKGDAEMRFTTVRPSISNMLITIMKLFICFMVIPSSSFADPFWSIGISGGNGGINGFTLSIGDYGGIPIYIEQDGPPCGHSYGYYDDHPGGYYHNYPRPNWRGNNFHHEGNPHPMNGQNGYQQNGLGPNPHNQHFNSPNGFQQNGYRQNQQMQNIDKQKRETQHQWEMSMMNKGMSRQNQHGQSFNRPNGYQQNGSIQNQQMQTIDRQKREKQHQWEMSKMNKGM